MLFVIDTSTLIEMSEHYFPEIFPSFWDKIHNLVENEIILSLREVQLELGKGKFYKQWDNINNRANKKFFQELTDGEWRGIQEIEKLNIYSEKFRDNKGNNTSLETQWGSYAVNVADPFLICHALHHNSTVVTMKSPNKGHNIPHVCFELNVRCIGLKEFLLENNFKF